MPDLRQDEEEDEEKDVEADVRSEVEVKQEVKEEVSPRSLVNSSARVKTEPRKNEATSKDNASTTTGKEVIREKQIGPVAMYKLVANAVKLLQFFHSDLISVDKA
ncbi:hypothetical protein DVH05_021467 [Phytophthora capsici]|nr:hypothetical protein DVH05_021467 [Phytophthora capsici]